MSENIKEIFSINDRIKYLINHYELSRYKFSQETGVSDAVLFNIYKGKNKPSFDVIEKILNTYRSIDANWLLTGEGTMFREEPSLSKLDEPVEEYKLTKSGQSGYNSSELIAQIIELSAENALLKKEIADLKTQILK